MKNYRAFFLKTPFVFIVFSLFNACIMDLPKSDTSKATTAKSILNFEFKKSLNPNLDADILSKITDNNIVLTVPFGTDVTALKPSITFFANQISPLPEVVQDFTKPVVYSLTAKNGSSSFYTVSVVVSPNTAKEISSFTIKSSNNLGVIPSDITAEILGTNINFTLPYGTALTAITPSTSHTGASISPANQTVVDFTKPVTFTVTAADGSQKNYTATATVALSPNKNMNSFSFKASLNPSIGAADIVGTITGTDVTVKLPYGTDITKLKPTIIHEGNTLNIANETAIDFSNFVIYTVTAAYGSQKNYSINAQIIDANSVILTNLISHHSTKQRLKVCLIELLLT